MAALIVQLAIACLFCILGAVLIQGKGAFLIAGYNTSSPREKAIYDEKALCRAVGVMMFSLTACMVIAGIGTYFMLAALVWGGYALFLVAIIVGLIYVNTSKRLKRK